MKLNENELQSFVMAELNTYDLNDLSLNTELALKEIRDELLEELEDLNSDDTKQARLDYFKVQGAKKDDYREKLIEVEKDKAVIYGIRNMGGNPEIPFIQIRPNFSISSKEESLKIYDLIKEDFKLFKPLYLSFQAVRKAHADFYGSVHMIARTSELINKEKWPHEDSIEFTNISDDSYYDWYTKGYEEFHTDHPELKNKVTINSSESMKDTLLKLVTLGGERIGLIAGEESNFLGNSGVYFHEIFISKKWKGKGLAKAIQRKFVEIFCSELDFVWGTIDCNNLPSYKTASSNGRRPVRYECFVNLK